MTNHSDFWDSYQSYERDKFVKDQEAIATDEENQDYKPAYPWQDPDFNAWLGARLQHQDSPSQPSCLHGSSTADPVAEDIVNRLGGRQVGENTWYAKCPAHEEKTASLKVHVSAGKVLVHCFGGCSQKEVIGALRDIGLWGSPAPRDLQKAKRRADHARIDHLKLMLLIGEDSLEPLTESQLDELDAARKELLALLDEALEIYRPPGEVKL